LRSMIPGACMSRGFAVRTRLNGSRSGLGRDSWGRKKHCIRRRPDSPANSMRPSPNHFGHLSAVKQIDRNIQVQAVLSHALDLLWEVPGLSGQHHKLRRLRPSSSRSPIFVVDGYARSSASLPSRTPARLHGTLYT